jgi:O-antigen/teichoic acid export membrane protein
MINNNFNLKEKVIIGVRWTTLSAIIILLVQLIQLSILARFLDPSEFGLMALVMVIVGFSHTFMDMGISNVLIYKQNIDKEHLSTLYWISLIFGGVFFIIMILISPLIAAFYKEPILIELIHLVSITFIIQPLGQQFMVLLKKDMRFSEIAKIDIINKTMAMLISVYFAYLGYGIHAVVYGLVVGTVIQSTIYLYIGIKEFRPSLIFKLKGISSYLSFGAYQTGEKTINYFNLQIDTIIIGRLLGMEILGIYTIAKEIAIRPAQIINLIISKVSFPAMAKVQDDILQLKNVYLKILNYLLSITLPIYVFIFIFAYEIVIVLFGEQWLQSVIILQILSIWGALKSVGLPIGSLVLSKGKANWAFWWNVSLFCYIPACIYIGSFWGIIGVSYSLVLSLIPVVTIATWYFLVKPLCKAKYLEYHYEIFVPSFISVVSAILTYMCIDNIEWFVTKITIGIFIGIIFILLMNYIFNRRFIFAIKHIMKIN